MHKQVLMVRFRTYNKYSENPRRKIQMNEFNRNLQTTTNIQEKSQLIWNNAEVLRGLYKPHEYGEVILPMTVIKRFHDTLLPTRDKVLEVYEKVDVQ